MTISLLTRIAGVLGGLNAAIPNFLDKRVQKSESECLRDDRLNL